MSKKYESISFGVEEELEKPIRGFNAWDLYDIDKICPRMFQREKLETEPEDGIDKWNEQSSFYNFFSPIRN